MNPARPTSRGVARAAGIALLAAALTLLRFAPAYGLWRALGLPEARPDPALNRAVDMLGQLARPLGFVATPNNRVIEWRLFFPLLGHALALPAPVYLALPHLGCLAVLAFVAWLCLRRGWKGPEALVASLLVATCSWFFVSTGWLGYFDSWYILALLVAALAPSRAAAIAAILVGPWIDERFVLAFPLVLLLRARQSAEFGDGKGGGLLLAAALLPWIAVRLVAQGLDHDRVTGAYLAGLHPLANGPYYVLGIWEGLRWAWLAPIGWLALEAQRGGGRSLGLAVACFLGVLAVTLAAANDLSRSASVAVPAAVFGLLALQRRHPVWFRPGLVVVCALNLATPARHVVAGWTEPILPLPVEIVRANHPPPELDPAVYTADAVALNARGEFDGAVRKLDEALLLDDRYAPAHADRAYSLFRLGRKSEAEAEVDRALSLDPGLYEARYNRALMRAEAGDLIGAKRDLEQALRDAPADWPGRAAAASAVQALNGR